MKERQIINKRQIKAARALLEWSQDNLAHASGLSVSTIRKIESGHISPRKKTIESIASSFEMKGIEFLGTEGVQKKEESIKIIEGDDRFVRLLDKIYYDINESNAEILFMNADGSRATAADLAAHVRLRNAGARYRLLYEEGNTHLHFPLNEYRWVPQKYFKYNVMVLFKDMVAIDVYDVTSQKRKSGKIFIIKNIYLLKTLKHIFEFMWDNSRKPTLTTASEVFD